MSSFPKSKSHFFDVCTMHMFSSVSKGELNLAPCDFSGKVYEKVCEMCHITVNKVAIFSENGVISPGGVRIGKQIKYSRKSQHFGIRMKLSVL